MGPRRSRGVAGRRARRKTQGSDARSEDIARGSSVNPKEVRRGRRPARSATRPRPLNLLNENPSLSLSGSSPVRTRKRRYQWSDGITAVFPARFARYQCSGAITAAFPARFARDQWSGAITAAFPARFARIHPSIHPSTHPSIDLLLGALIRIYLT